MAAHDVIYVPGIGDTKTTFQALAIKSWRLWGVVPHIFPMRWADQESIAPKFGRLLDYIDNLLEQGHKVSLVGASAGASVVINAFAARPEKISGVVCIAGKVNRPEAIGSWYKRNALAFVESANQATASLNSLNERQLRRINSRYSPVDIIVPKKDSVIPGATNTAVFSFGHAITIAVQLIFGAPSWLRFLKKL